MKADLLSRQRLFLSSKSFAVVGASKDESKYGTTVLRWYLDRAKAVTPVHPKERELQGIATVSSIADLPVAYATSVSIITPPKVTIQILRQAKELKVPALWLQPGAEDEEVVDFVTSNGLTDRVIYGGPCILVEGDSALKSSL
ncbi:NAD-P-binding protein [Pterulicium gracile]|uniref:NAD-P-binding protein n=1 Tax=Pterulicium gracile TaxID=1884261 RepID=A0A5C3QZS0_9AGAR|nr:NAD-P-binding protein [Pterula gracilis]